MLALASDLWREHGARGLYRGAPATMAGAVGYEGLRFGAFGALKDRDPLSKSSVLAASAYGTIASLLAGERSGRAGWRAVPAV